MTAVKFKVKKGDRVIVQTGRDKGKVGTVLKVLTADNALLVEGVNVVTRHLKVSPGNPDGIVRKESKIHVSNVALLDPKTNEPTKVGYKTLADGQKVRVAKKSGETL
jgi:large subunit ribosomal protein L24